MDYLNTHQPLDQDRDVSIPTLAYMYSNLGTITLWIVTTLDMGDSK